jgi:hypothetical protein
MKLSFGIEAHRARDGKEGSSWMPIQAGLWNHGAGMSAAGANGRPERFCDKFSFNFIPEMC